MAKRSDDAHRGTVSADLPTHKKSGAGKDRVVVTVAGQKFLVRPSTADRIRKIAAGDLNWAGGAPLYPGLWAAEHGDDVYRIWRKPGGERSPDTYELWWWDGPYTGVGDMGADLRSAENAYVLDSYPTLRAAKIAAERHARSKTKEETLL